MTKRRLPLTIEGAVTKALAALGDDGVAAATNRSPRLVRAWSDPDDETHRIPFHQALALDLACIHAGEPAYFHQFHRAMLATVAAEGGRAPLDALAEVMAEIGDVAAVIRDALRPDGAGGGAITLDEYERSVGEITQAREALDRVERALAEASGAVVARRGP